MVDGQSISAFAEVNMSPPAGFNQAIDDIINGQKKGDGVDQLIQKYRRLSRFVPPEKRVKMAKYFVSFCSGKISGGQFQQKVESLGGFRQRAKKSSPRPSGRFFFKPSR